MQSWRVVQAVNRVGTKAIKTCGRTRPQSRPFLTIKVFVKSLIAVSFSLPSPLIKRGTWQSEDVFGPEHVGLFIANMNKVPKFVYNMFATPINHRYIMIYLYHWHPYTILTVTYLETIRRYQKMGLPMCWSPRTISPRTWPELRNIQVGVDSSNWVQ